MADEELEVSACMDADDLDNCTNGTKGDVVDVPRADMLEYAEIVLLSLMVIIGGPLNIARLHRSCSRNEDRNTPRRHGSWRRNSERKIMIRSSSLSRSSLLRLHLTIANLFIICIYGISQICWLSTYSWKGGDILCRLVKFFHTFCFYLTSNIIVVVAIDRLYVTRYVDRPPRSPKPFAERWFNKTVCWIPWILAFMCSVPQLFVWNVILPYPDNPDWCQCVTIWVSWKVENIEALVNRDLSEQLNIVTLQESIYSISHLILVFWCPALVVVCSYMVIVARFRKKILKTRLETQRTQRSANVEQFRVRAAKLHLRLYVDTVSSEESSVGLLADIPIIISTPQIFLRPLTTNVAILTLSRVKRRTIRASAYIAFAYVACWTPYNALELWRFFYPTLENRYLELLSNLIVLNAVLNPLIYDTRPVK